MGPGHDRSHAAGRAHDRSRLRLVLLVTLSVAVVELIGAVLSDSLALLADAGHMFTDTAALAVALSASYVATLPASPRRTFGYHRTEILAALANGATLVAISVYVMIEAVHRFQHPTKVEAPLMMGIAAGGLLVNLISLRILSGGKSESLNVRGAWLHVLTDALGSVQAIAAGVLIWAFGWSWADPVASILISLLVIYSAWDLLRETLGVLMEGTPGHIDVDEVRGALTGISGVVAVHDLHVWTITSGMESLSVHVVVEDEAMACTMLGRVRKALHDRFGIDHLTVQVEPVAFEEHGSHA